MIVHLPTSTHPRLDLDAARRIFGAAGHDRDLAGDAITSPFHVYAIETLRDRHALRVGDPEPTDVFVFSRGTPRRGDLTQIGGMPFWPAKRPWPTNPRGEPCSFLAQVNFSDSRDLVGELPGDVLLLLVDTLEDGLLDDHPVRFEWVQSDIEPIEEFDEELVVFAGEPFYGVIHRTADYPDAHSAATGLARSGPLLELAGTKIGGVPHLIQGDPQGFAGRLLFQLGSIQAAPGVPYPWADRPEPLRPDFDGVYSEDHSFMIGDAGMLYVIRRPSGELRAWSECY